MIRKLFLVLVSVFIIASVIGAVWFNKYLKEDGPLQQEVTVIIAPGSSINIIAKILKANEVIDDERIFSLVARVLSYNSPLKSGEYLFTKNITPNKIIEILQSGKSVARKITITEGMSVKQILQLINEEKFLNGAKIIGDIDEGSLLPSTYHFSYGDKKQDVIRNMQEAHRQVMADLLDKYDIKLPLTSKKDVLVLASIVEKEAPNDEERPLIAGVFLNRLKAGMKLQADPTVLYAITNGRYDLGRLLLKKDLEYESPYNTYLFKGLPPAPICCPGRSSIEAVLNPTETKAYYFVVNGEGGHSFARSLNEHLKNVKKYRKLQKAMRRKAAQEQGNQKGNNGS